MGEASYSKGCQRFWSVLAAFGFAGGLWSFESRSQFVPTFKQGPEGIPTFPTGQRLHGDGNLDSYQVEPQRCPQSGRAPVAMVGQSPVRQIPKEEAKGGSAAEASTTQTPMHHYKPPLGGGRFLRRLGLMLRYCRLAAALSIAGKMSQLPTQIDEQVYNYGKRR